jgi:hypothetical protein
VAADVLGGVKGLRGGDVGWGIRASVANAVGEGGGGARCEVGAAHT